MSKNTTCYYKKLGYVITKAENCRYIIFRFSNEFKEKSGILSVNIKIDDDTIVKITKDEVTGIDTPKEDTGVIDIARSDGVYSRVQAPYVDIGKLVATGQGLNVLYTDLSDNGVYDGIMYYDEENDIFVVDTCYKLK